MSKEKMDRYKEEKANRKKNVAKQKRNALISKIATVVLVIGIVAWIGWSGYRNHQEQESLEAAQSSFNEWLSEYYATMETTDSSATTAPGETTGKGSGEDETTTKAEGETKEGETKEPETSAGETEAE